jgi:predicted nucleic acid-binding protein
MPAKLFLDTNVLVYAFDWSEPEKRLAAQEMIQREVDWCISWQVVQEFSSLALHRFKRPMLPEDLRDYLDLVLLPNCRVMPTAAIYGQALRIQSQAQYCFYDSLIVAAALVSGAKQLYSENLEPGGLFGTLEIVNPFK